MALREYTDSGGTTWQIWNVRPTTRYSSPLVRAERRVRASPHFHPDRRTGGFSPTPGLEKSWLCFECADEKRRLFPTPRDRESCPAEVPEGYLKAANPIRRRILDDAESGAAQPRMA